MKCRNCGQDKPETAFWKKSRNKSGRRHTCSDCMNLRRRTLYRKDPRGSMLRDARRRALRQNVPFDITKKDIQIPEFCPVLGIKLAVSHTGNPTHNSPTIDKIEPMLGYVPGNIAIISHRANSLKSDATPEELANIFAWVTTEHLRKSTAQRGKTPIKKKSKSKRS